MTTETELSEREREIIRLVATGASNKQIAQQLYISANTVKVHLRNIFAKIGVASRTEATLFAIREGLVPPPAGMPVLEAEIASDGADGAIHPEDADIARPSKRRTGVIVLLSAVVLIVVGAIGYSLRPLILPQAAPTSQPTPERWQVRAPMPTARSGLAAVAYDGQIYAIGGEGKDGVSGDVYCYFPEKNSWKRMSNKPVPVTDISAAVMGEKIYIPGGKLSDGNMSNKLEVFEPRNNLWEEKANLPIGLSRYGLAAFEGRLYVFGGWNGFSYLATVFVYDPVLDRWEKKADMRSAKADTGIAVGLGRIFVMGGYNGKAALEDNDVFYPERNQQGEAVWETRASLPKGLYRFGIVNIIDSLFLFGGLDQANDPSNESWVYNIQQDNWQSFSIPRDSSYRPGMGILSFGDQIYFLGGNDGQSSTSIVESYRAIYTALLPVLSK